VRTSLDEYSGTFKESAEAQPLCRGSRATRSNPARARTRMFSQRHLYRQGSNVQWEGGAQGGFFNGCLTLDFERFPTKFHSLCRDKRTLKTPSHVEPAYDEEFRCRRVSPPRVGGCFITAQANYW